MSWNPLLSNLMLISEYIQGSLVAQTVKNLPEMPETWVWSPGWEDPLEEAMATHSSILAWRIPMDEGAWWAKVHEVAKNQTRLSNQTQQCWVWSLVHPTLLHLSHGLSYIQTVCLWSLTCRICLHGFDSEDLLIPIKDRKNWLLEHRSSSEPSQILLSSQLASKEKYHAFSSVLRRREKWNSNIYSCTFTVTILLWPNCFIPPPQRLGRIAMRNSQKKGVGGEGKED